MWVFIREGSSTRNLADLIPMVLRGGTAHVALCTDDREPDLILARGHVNDCVRLAVEHGVTHRGRARARDDERGRVPQLPPPRDSSRPGYQADVLAFDSLDDLAPTHGVATRPARGGATARSSATRCRVPRRPTGCCASVHLAHRPDAAELDPRAAAGRARPGDRGRRGADHDRPPRRRRHRSRASTSRASRVLERHHATGRIGLGWVSGFGLARGAIASTVAHDAHNCMVVGARATRPARATWPSPWRGSPRSAAVRSRCSTAG